MTFSFRPRHDTWDSAHERARYRAAERVDGMIDPAEEIWLEEHLAGCSECRAIADDYAAAHQQLRSFRGQLPDPPRDLWARTAAAIEQEASRSMGQGRATARRSFSMPMGAISGLLVVAVVLGAAFLSRPIGPSPEPRGSSVALQPSPASFVVPRATPMQVTADVDYVKLGDKGIRLFQTKVREVCSESDETACAAIPESSPVAVELPAEPESVIKSPTQKEIIVISGAQPEKGASLVVVPVPDTATASPSPVRSSSSPLQPSSPTSSVSPSPTPTGPVEVLGEQIFDPSAAYSEDGNWFAFSARPADGSHGPDIYVVKAGSPTPVALTTDHRSVFGSWLDNVVIGSRVLPDLNDESSQDPGAIETQTFAIDPATGASAIVSGRGLWRPTIDPNHRLAVYWNGSVERDGAPKATTDGGLVIGAWPSFDPATLSEEPAESSSPTASDEASPVEPSAEPTGEASTSAEPSPSTAASAEASSDEDVQILERGPILDWDARWDETGTHLAVWIATSTDRAAGVLSLYVLDSQTGRLIADDDAIKRVPSLPGFSIGHGRLAYATPVGQDAKGSSVRVQAWTKDGIGEGATEGGQDQVLVVR